MTIEFHVTAWNEVTWDEKPAQEVTTEKQTYSIVKYNYRGELTGESEIRYLMSYRADSSGHYVAIEHINGKLDGKSGTLTLQHIGTFTKSGVQGTCTVVASTGELEGVSGTGSIDLGDHQEWYTLTFDYTFPE